MLIRHITKQGQQTCICTTRLVAYVHGTTFLRAHTGILDVNIVHQSVSIVVAYLEVEGPKNADQAMGTRLRNWVCEQVASRSSTLPVFEVLKTTVMWN